MSKSSMKKFYRCLSPSRKSGSGYTLIEMTIVILVLGGILSTIASSVALYLKHQKANTTLNNASLITAAINTYLIQHGAYPCPARMNAARTDPDYGFGGNCADVTTVPTGQCLNGYCVQQSDRSWDPTPPAGWTAPWPPIHWSDRVRRGAVPFRDLGLEEYLSEDGYGDRFEYIVTESLAVQATYNKYNGGIDVVDDNLISSPEVMNPPTGTQMDTAQCPNSLPSGVKKEFCLGGGPINGNYYYRRLVTAPAGSVGGSVHFAIISNGPDRAGAFSHEGQVVNACPGLAGTLDAVNCYISNINLPQAIYRLAPYSDAAGANHFDDTVKFYSSVEAPLWQVQGATGLDMNDLVQASDAAGAGKVGIDITPSQTGMAPANNGAALQVAADVVAEENIKTSQLCDPKTGNCIGAAMNFASCPASPQQEVATGFNGTQLNCQLPKTGCLPGQVMSGIDSQGNLICSTVVSCPTLPVNLCQTSAGVYDQVTIPAGYPNDNYTTRVSGSSYTESFTCTLSGASSASWVQTGSNGVCTCNSTPSQYTQSCYKYLSSGCSKCWSGLVTLQSTTACPAGTTSTTLVSNTCQCVNYTKTYTSTCPSGTTGTLTTSQSYTCDPSNPTAPAVAGPKTTTGTCICDPTATSTQTITCQSAGYGAGYSGSVTQTRTMDCSTNSWGSWTTKKDTCKCSAVIQYQQIGCPAPQVGTQYQSQTYDCTANAWGPWTTYSNTCGSVVHSWEMGSSPSGTTSNPSSIQVGQSCTNVGQTAPCSASAGSGSYYQYPVCQCQ